LDEDENKQNMIAQFINLIFAKIIQTSFQLKWWHKDNSVIPEKDNERFKIF
jgi:hypothetical protein